MSEYLQEVIRSMGALLFAGSDTTASTLTVVTMFLAKYPEVQQRMHDEIDAFCGDGVRTCAFRQQLDLTQFSDDVIQQLTYTDACIKEAMRLVPVASGYIALAQYFKLSKHSFAVSLRGKRHEIHLLAVARAESLYQKT